ncbi:hypothetical protein VTJ04DRAFT_4184 [Mycothermus thermophilus]|uniref:uncharacterized protein n=1 Tax=Humicola insolens TaxID=85995 RepID=UPI00374348DF
MANTTAGVVASSSKSLLTEVIKRHPLGKRIQYGIAAFILTRLIQKPLIFFSALGRFIRARRESDPDVIKSYPVRKHLSVRIFLPTPNPPEGTKLPTLLTIHGGGFMLGSPHDNDGWNRAFSARHNFLVIALDYSKAPSVVFPTPLHDVEALIACVLSDSSLPIDHSRIAVAGFSAGGNLSLSVSQLPSVRPHIRAVVPFYPVVDLSVPTAVKTRTRPYKPALGGFRGRSTDFLTHMIPLFNWAYLTPGQRTDDPLLSPFYASREDLPKNVFIVACELDILAAEAWRMACKLAGKKVPKVEEAVGRPEPFEGEEKGELITEGDERYAWDVILEDGSRYSWLLVPDTAHGFDQDNIGDIARDPVFVADGQAKRAQVIDLVGRWLLDGPLKGK